MRMTMKVAAATAAFGILLAGCNQQTPEDRFQKANMALQQNDTLTAELEAKKIISKNPDDPLAVQAHILLAQVYYKDQRPDDALDELKAVLDKVTQKDARGKSVLAMYLQILKQQKRFPDALKIIDKYQKENASDDGTSLSLTVARADIMTESGETTAARAVFLDLHESTTNPKEAAIYAPLILKTYLRTGDTTGGLAYYKEQFGREKDETFKREMLLTMGALAATQGNYDETRKWTEESTKVYDAAIKDELDARKKTELAYELAFSYIRIGNLEGARKILENLFATSRDQQIVQMTMNDMMQVLMRQGKVDDAVAFLRQAGAKFKVPQLAQQATQIEEAKKLGKLNGRDTSTLVLQFEKDALLAPVNLPKVEASASTETLAASGTETTSTAISAETSATAPKDKETSGGK